jgi:hypothetical protein
MKKLIKKLEDIMVAVTFAEAGEFDEANKQAGNKLQEDMNGSVVDAFRRSTLENAKK